MTTRRGFIAKFAAAFGAVAAVGTAAVAAPTARRELVEHIVEDENGFAACRIICDETPRQPIIVGTKLVFGVPTVTKPICGVRPGARVRFVFRAREFARVYVRENGLTVALHIKDNGSHWEPTLPVAANTKEAA